MTAKELQPGMKLYTSRWGICTVSRTFHTGKRVIVVVCDPRHLGVTHEVSKFPNSVVAVVREEANQL
jgi:hypothetical protein